jgi:hypothetical protein
VEPIVERAIQRGQLPRGTNAAELLHYVAAPLFHRLLVLAEPLTRDAADRAAAAALARREPGVGAVACCVCGCQHPSATIASTVAVAGYG